MSVTLKQALVLPSLRQATLLAGFDNLDRPITSVNVLEYIGAETLHQQSEPAGRFAGGELVLTCFSSIPTNVDAQCECLRALSQVGQAGLVLYYVGSVMPQVDPALVTLAQELDFPLLVMPHRTELRYSEVIGDVMEAILRDQADNTHLLGDILEHMTLLPEHQRTVDTVLQLLSDRLRATVLLLDGTGQLLGACAWPRGSQADMTDLLIQARQGNADQCCRLTIDPGDAAPMELCLLKAGQPLSNEVQQQAQDVMQLALNLWSLMNTSTTTMSYSRVLSYFQSQQVVDFEMDLNTGDIKLALVEGSVELPSNAVDTGKQPAGRGQLTQGGVFDLIRSQSQSTGSSRTIPWVRQRAASPPSSPAQPQCPVRAIRMQQRQSSRNRLSV